MKRNPPRNHRDAGVSRRRAELYASAYNSGLTQSEADQWVHEQLYPRRRGNQDKTPTLFGAWLARETLAQQKGATQ